MWIRQRSCRVEEFLLIVFAMAARPRKNRSSEVAAGWAYLLQGGEGAEWFDEFGLE